MARKSNDPVGVCPCPVGKCSADRAPLFRFATRAASAATARKAGKYYGRCPNHGWFGYDGAPAMQTYIRESGKLNEGETWAVVESSDASGSGASDQEPKPAPATLEKNSSPKPAPPPKPAALPTSKGQPKPAARPNVWDL